MKERVAAIVPIRSLRDGKTRLATVLSADERATLLRLVAERVIGAARDSGAIERVVIVSPDERVLAWAAGLGHEVVALPQPEESPGLNAAIDLGRQWAIKDGYDAVFSIFADLPFLTPDEVRDLALRPEAVVLGQDRHGQGTNALLLRLAEPGLAFQYAFGEGSLTRHLAEARQLGLAAAVHESPGIAFDLDTPADWTAYLNGDIDPIPTLVTMGAGNRAAQA